MTHDNGSEPPSAAADPFRPADSPVGSDRQSRSGRRTVPAVGRTVPARARSRVVLPAPSPPTTAATVPAATSKVTSSQPTVGP